MTINPKPVNCMECERWHFCLMYWQHDEVEKIDCREEVE